LPKHKISSSFLIVAATILVAVTERQLQYMVAVLTTVIASTPNGSYYLKLQLQLNPA